MLVKCVCTNCGHSYLSDDQQGDLSCPRCGVANEGTRNPSDIPNAPAGAMDGPYDHLDEGEFEDFLEDSFDPKAPPPIVVTIDRMVRGILFGMLVTLVAGTVLGAALGATRVAVPVVAGVLLSFVAAASCRAGFGGRSGASTKVRCIVCLVIIMAVGVSGFLAGGWLVERWTGDRAGEVREDLKQGLRTLNAQHSGETDEGRKILIEERLHEIHRLQALSDAQLEDYLWVQEAALFPNDAGYLNVPVLAYAAVRATRGPSIQFGPEADPVEVPKEANAGLLLAEILIGVILGLRGVTSKGR